MSPDDTAPSGEGAREVVIVCEPRLDCADPHLYRWHCARGHEGAAPDECRLVVCIARGANR